MIASTAPYSHYRNKRLKYEILYTILCPNVIYRKIHKELKSYCAKYYKNETYSTSNILKA